MSLPEQLNHYRILEPLGKGGMGEVFVAEDTRLQRRVALKVLSSLMASDPERRQRFEREAQAVAALNHPNIVTIHSVEEDRGIPFLTMELVEGRTLGDLIAEGPLPLDRLLRIGGAISDAIAAAHQRGITHRDLKPANVVVGPDGRVKVLDFGLAKLRESQLAGDSDVTRMPTTDLTGEGRIIGTVAYMSPEQAEGKPVDPRTDIFSLGVLLYEMATGEKPFKGDTNVSILSSVLKDTPRPITEIRSELPQELERVVRRALAKDPSRRYQTATDVRNDLEELKLESDSGVRSAIRAAPGVGRAVPRQRLALIATAMLVVTGIAAALFMVLNRDRAGGEPLVFEADRFSRLTGSGDASLAALSPDGRYVAHVKSPRGQPSLWMRQTATTSDVEIVPPAQVRYDGVSFSPEGDYVYYNTYELTGGVAVLYRVPVLGGTPQRVLEDVDSRISFAPDRRRFAFTRGAPSRGIGSVMIANADGTGVRELSSLRSPQQFANSGPSWSPDGRTILAVAQSVEGGPHALVLAVDAEDGAVTRVPGRWVFAGDVGWLPDGRAFVLPAADFNSGGGSQIWQVSYPSGETRRITNDLNSYVSATFSSDGRSLATVQAENSPNLWVASASDLGGGQQITRGQSRGDGLTGTAWTPDGRIVYGSLSSGRPQIWIVNADGANARQLTADDAPSVQPHVTPDGRYVVFQRFGDRGVNIWRMGIDGSDVRQLTHGGADILPRAGVRDVFFNNGSSGQPRPFKVSIDGGQPVSLGAIYFRPQQVSPDGSRLLGTTWDEKARRPAVAMMPAAGGALELVPEVTTFGFAWGPDANALTYWHPKQGVQFYRYDLTTKKSEPIGLLRDNIFGFAWARDGKRMVIARGPSTTDVVLISAKSKTP